MKQKRKKIALFIESLEGGGEQRIMVNLSNHLASLGYPVEIVVTRSNGVFESQLSPIIQLISLGYRKPHYSLFAFIKYLNQNKPAIVISTLELINLIALLGKRITRSDGRFIIRVALMVSAKRHRFGKRLLEKSIIQALYPSADEIIAVSKGVAEDLSDFANIDRNRITTLYNPVISEELIHQSHEPVKHPWFADGQPPVILGVGRLTEQKNFEMLIRAFHRIQKQIDCRLVILGEGERRKNLETLITELEINEKVDMPGFVINPYAFMRNSAVFVLTSNSEGLPTVLIEALSCGAHVISTDCPSGPREILNNGKYGTLVPIGEVDPLVKAILEVFQGKKTDIPTKWLEQFTVENSLEKILILINS